MLSSWQRRAAAVAALAVPALVVAGCTSTTPGTTSLGTSTSASTPAATGGSASGSATPTSSKSARPRSIDVTNVDPCQLLTPQQRQQFGFDRPWVPSAEENFGVGKVCSTRDSVHNTGAMLSVVTSFGIGTFTDGSRQVQTEPTQVAGFPAVVVHAPGQTVFCDVAVDVADGQFFKVKFTDASSKLSPEQVCQGAQNVADAAMATLKGAG